MKTSTFVAGLTLHGMIAPFVLNGLTLISRSAFETYIEKVLVPELRSGDIVIMDNLSGHKGQAVRQNIEAADAEIRFLQHYSPDLNPIEKAFTSSRRCCEKSVGVPSTVCGPQSERSSKPLSSDENRNYFVHAGYDPG